ncbi:LPXTG cell wall anchor domain-containing protein [Paenibacillus tritici]|uniref:LPXTG cell wall anchor domain-containing protein n=1 Tax=Paenibacillus tritici TaxID=1873425 RepID=A0ABX2DY14_9BACL|nr:LPXTG cell wall anchor domain-containing protein [Paenibacillus tritici]
MPTPTPIIGFIVSNDVAIDEVAIDEDPLPLGPVATPAATLAPTPAPTPAVAVAPVAATPEPTPSAVPTDVIIVDEEVPLGGVPADGVLPKTGESSPAPYYFAGLALAGLGLILRRTARNGKRK